MTGDGLLADSVDRLLAETAGDPDAGWDPERWRAAADAGLCWVSVPEEIGGSGGSLADAAVILHQVGRHAAPLPLAESGMLAGWLLASAGLSLPDDHGPITVGGANPGDVARVTPTPGGVVLSARLHRVPWARQAAAVVVSAEGTQDGRCWVGALPSRMTRITPGENLAGEPRDLVEVEGVTLGPGDAAPAPRDAGPDGLRRRTALARAVLMAGAMEAVVGATLAYAHDRHQFGRPLEAFQAIQHHLVRLAAEVAGVGLAAQVAVGTCDGEVPAFEAALAKATASAATGVVTGLAHQVHGAIGMTREHPLQRYTRRLWAWRQEGGSERWWNRFLGDHVAGGGADGLWPLLATGLGSRR